MMATILGRSTETAAGSGGSTPAMICSSRSGVTSSGLLHLEELRVAEEYRQAAASTVGAGGVPHIGLNTETLQPPGGEQEQEAGQPRPQAHQPQGPPRSGEAQAGLVFLRMEEHQPGPPLGRRPPASATWA